MAPPVGFRAGGVDFLATAPFRLMRLLAARRDGRYSGTVPGPQGTDGRTSRLAARVRPMDCREFRNKHVAFVDDLLPAVEMEAMHAHRATCHRCSRHDTAIRRSLLIVRNLPPIEPSPDFMVRLESAARSTRAHGARRSRSASSAPCHPLAHVRSARRRSRRGCVHGDRDHALFLRRERAAARAA